MTPLARCSGVRLAILLYAPRSLNENTCAQDAVTKLSPVAFRTIAHNLGSMKMC